MSKKRVLLVPGWWALAEHLRADGHTVVEAATADDAAERVDAGVDAVLIDMRHPAGAAAPKSAAEPKSASAAFDALIAARQRDPDPPVIVLADPEEQSGLVADALGAGAFDFVLDPVGLDDVARRVTRAFEVTRLRRELRTLRDRLARPFTLASILGASPAMQTLRDLARRLSVSDAPVLLSGERGTGRDHLARVMHYTGTRAMGPFLKVECAALSERELELELFGREPGGDTPFLVRGVMDEAHDGTLFLNDAGALPASIQQRLLRYIETGAFRRRGDSPDIIVDVRIIAATDRPLEPEVAAGRFRAELFYRIKVLTVETPPLAAHLDDVPVLVHHFLEQRRRAGGHRVTAISDAALRLLQKYSWPGNMDELRAVVDRAAMLAAGTEIGAAEVATLSPRAASAPPAPSTAPPAPAAPAVRAGSEGTFELPDAGIDLAAVEKSLVLQALDRAGGNQTKAAALLGIHRDHVRYRLRKWREGT